MRSIIKKIGKSLVKGIGHHAALLNFNENWIQDWSLSNLAIDGHSFIIPYSSLSQHIKNGLNFNSFYNGAVAGSVISNLVSRAATLDAKIATETTTLKNILVVNIGINEVSDIVGSGATAFAALKPYILNRLTAGWKVFLFTMTPCLLEGYGEQYEIERAYFNSKLKNDLAKRTGVYVIDLDAIPELADSTDTDYYSDGIHPAELGGKLMADALLAKVGLLSASALVDTVNYGYEQIVNGIFDDSYGWMLGSGITIGSGKLNFAGTGYAKAYTGVILESGKSYRLTADVVATSGTLEIYPDGNALGLPRISINATSSVEVVKTANSTGSLNLYFECSPDFTGSIDNLSFKEVL